MNQSLSSDRRFQAMHREGEVHARKESSDSGAKPKSMVITGTLTSSLFPGMVTPSSLATLVTRAPDKEILLATKLPLHQFIHPARLGRIKVEDFWFSVNGELQGVVIPDASGRVRLSRDIRIDPESGPVVQALLPDSGPVFSSPNPFGRAQRFAASLGIVLTRKGARQSCLLYAFAMGISWNRLLELAGESHPHLRSRHLYCPVSRQEAEAYWHVSFDLERIRSLPKYLHRLPTTTRTAGGSL
jgi:hypothetical protein